MSEMEDVLERGYELMWRRRDFAAAVRVLPADFEWVMPGHLEGAVRRGPAETAQFFREWTEGFDDLDVDWVLHPAGPDTVLVELSMNGRGRDSGVPVRLRIGQLWTFRQGVPQRMVLFTDYEKARRAAGLAG